MGLSMNQQLYIDIKRKALRAFITLSAFLTSLIVMARGGYRGGNCQRTGNTCSSKCHYTNVFLHHVPLIAYLGFQYFCRHLNRVFWGKINGF